MKEQNLSFGAEVLNRLPAQEIILEENGATTRIRIIAGFRASGEDAGENGVFTLSGASQNSADGENHTTYIMTQDGACPPVQGVMLRDGQMVQQVGFDDAVPPEEIVQELGNRFLACDRFVLVKGE